MGQPTRHGPFAKLLTSSGRTYRLTANDVLWAARMNAYEGGDPAANLWTLTQRYLGTAYRQYPSFAAFVRAFSQPINPDWARGGAFCRPGGKYARSSYCAEARLARRDEAMHASYAQLTAHDPEALEVTLAWAAGRLPNPVPRAVNFADSTVSASFLAQQPDAQVILRAGNVYIAESWSQPWRRDYISMQGFDGSVANADGVALPGALRSALASAYAGMVHPIRWG